MRRLTSRVRVFWRGLADPGRLDSDMSDEMRFHLDMETQRIMRVTGIEKYRRAARDVLGFTDPWPFAGPAARHPHAPSQSGPDARHGVRAGARDRLRRSLSRVRQRSSPRPPAVSRIRRHRRHPELGSQPELTDGGLALSRLPTTPRCARPGDRSHCSVCQEDLPTPAAQRCGSRLAADDGSARLSLAALDGSRRTPISGRTCERTPCFGGHAWRRGGAGLILQDRAGRPRLGCDWRDDSRPFAWWRGFP